MSGYRVEEAIRIDRPVAEVFAAWSSADRFAAWFAPMAVRPVIVKMDFEVGGHYRIEMDVGPGGVHVTEGRFVEIVPNERIRMSWRCDAWDDPPSEVEVRFAGEGTGTTVTVRHVAITTAPARDGQRFGWTQCLPALKRLLETRGETPH